MTVEHAELCILTENVYFSPDRVRPEMHVVYYKHWTVEDYCEGKQIFKTNCRRIESVKAMSFVFPQHVGHLRVRRMSSYYLQ